jgi:hypothetical protein
VNELPEKEWPVNSVQLLLRLSVRPLIPPVARSKRMAGHEGHEVELPTELKELEVCAVNGVPLMYRPCYLLPALNPNHDADRRCVAVRRSIVSRERNESGPV